LLTKVSVFLNYSVKFGRHPLSHSVSSGWTSTFVVVLVCVHSSLTLGATQFSGLRPKTVHVPGAGKISKKYFYQTVFTSYFGIIVSRVIIVRFSDCASAIIRRSNGSR